MTRYFFASRYCCRSPGYGISLVAETTSGCFISADNSVCYAQGEEEAEIEDEAMQDLIPPEDTGEQAAGVLLGEIEQGGVVDSTHQVVLKTCTFDHCCFMNFVVLLWMLF